MHRDGKRVRCDTEQQLGRRLRVSKHICSISLNLTVFHQALRRLSEALSCVAVHRKERWSRVGKDPALALAAAEAGQRYRL